MSIFEGNYEICKSCGLTYAEGLLDVATKECRDCKDFEIESRWDEAEERRDQERWDRETAEIEAAKLACP